MLKSVVALSGGLDSAVLLAHVVKNSAYGDSPEDVMCLAFTYGSRHNAEENKAAAAIAAHYRVSFTLFDITGLIDPFNSSVLRSVDQPVPEGHYEEESMRRTVVPGRNLIFASIMASAAESGGASYVFLGVHAGDHFIYPDCRLEFLSSLEKTIGLSSDGKVQLRAPFCDMTKAAIVRVGTSMQVPFHLTRTCYRGGSVACGRCGSCQERLEAFKLNGLEDPIEYETRELLSKSS